MVTYPCTALVNGRAVADWENDAFSPHFDSFSVGLCCDNYYGVQINLFLLVCRRKH
jgi:hypothetical protein